MFCPNCHKEIPDNAVFCNGCGTRIAISDTNEVNQQPTQQYIQQSSQITQQIPQQFSQQTADQFNAQPQQQFNEQQQFNGAMSQGVPMYNPQNAVPMGNYPAAAKKSFDFGAILKNKIVWICLAAVIIAVVAVIVIVNIASSSKNAGLRGTQIKEPLTVMTVSDGSYLYRSDKQIKKIDSAIDQNIRAGSGNANAILDSDKVLYVVSGDKITEVDQDVRKIYSISYNGDALVYLNTDYELLYYRNGSKKKIADIDAGNQAENIKTSPNGDTVVYTVYENNDIVTYVYDGSICKELSAKAMPLSVSNGGSIIYALNDNGRLGYFKNKNGDDFVSVKSTDNSYIFSEDNKSLLFESNGNTYYFDTSLEEAVKVCSGWIYIVTPKQTTGRINSFNNFLGEKDGSVYRFERNGDEFEGIKLISNPNKYQVSPDGSSIVYIKNDMLYMVDTETGENNTAFAKISSEDVRNFYAIPDFSGFYLIDRYNNLYYVDKKGGIVNKPFAENVAGAALDDSGVITYLSDYTNELGTLYYSSRGDKGKRVEGVGECSHIITDSYQVGIVSEYVGFTIYVLNEDYEVYISTNGKDFKKTNIETER